MEIECTTEDGTLKRALLARPTYLKGVHQSHGSWRGLPDPDLAIKQWEQICHILSQNGVDVHVYDDASAPDGAYMRDVGKVIGTTVHIFSPGGHRQGDQDGLVAFCKEHGLDFQLHVGTRREGADFLLIGGGVYVGIARRTKAPVFTQYPTNCVQRQGLRPPDGPEHLMGGHRKLGDVVYRLDGSAKLGHNYQRTTVQLTGKEFASRPLNWITISPNRVLLAEEAEHITGRVIQKNGVEVITTPCSELLKMGGGPACLTLPLLRES